MRIYSLPSPGSDTVFIQCDSETFGWPIERPRKSKPRWQSEMDQMLCDISDAEESSSKWTMVRPLSWIEILDVFDIVIGGSMPPATHDAITADHSIVPFEPAHAIMRLLDRYASAVVVLETPQDIHNTNCPFLQTDLSFRYAVS